MLFFKRCAQLADVVSGGVLREVPGPVSPPVLCFLVGHAVKKPWPQVLAAVSFWTPGMVSVEIMSQNKAFLSEEDMILS